MRDGIPTPSKTRNARAHISGGLDSGPQKGGEPVCNAGVHQDVRLGSLVGVDGAAWSALLHISHIERFRRPQRSGQPLSGAIGSENYG